MQAAFVDGILFSLCAGSLEPVLPFCPPPAVPEQTPSLCYAQKSTINSFVLRFYGTVMALFLFSLLFIFYAQRGRKENFYVSNHYFTRETNLGSSDRAGKEWKHHLYDSGHRLPPAGTGWKDGDRILFLLLQFFSGGPSDQGRCQKRHWIDHPGGSGTASLYPSEREKPGASKCRPQCQRQGLAVCTVYKDR